MNSSEQSSQQGSPFSKEDVSQLDSTGNLCSENLSAEEFKRNSYSQLDKQLSSSPDAVKNKGDLSSLVSKDILAEDPGGGIASLDQSTSLECLVHLDQQDVDALLALNDELSVMLDVKNTLRSPPPRIDLSPFECHSLQQDELQVLMSIYGEDVTSLNNEGTCFVVKIKFLSGEIKEDDVIKLWFSLPSNYPCVPPILEIEADQSGAFNYREADELFDLLMEESLKRIGEVMVFDLVTIAQDHMAALVEKKKMIAQQRQEEEKMQHSKLAEVSSEAKQQGLPVSDHVPLLGDFPAEVESTATEAASGIEGPEFEFHHRPLRYVGPISEIVKKLPPDMQLTRIENIMRQDLATRFQCTMDEFNKTLWQKARVNPMLCDITPRVAFHGTRTKSLPSIVHHGLVIPGQGNSVGVRSGSSLGLGIYVSPDPVFSFNYSDSSRLIVCAVILGKIRRGYCDSSHFDSVVCGSEWVLFNAAQVLPCYVIEVREDTSKSCSAVPPPLSVLASNLQQESESAQDRKSRLAARARKFLPYGYGPGKTTVIEDAASFDDDDEDYGDYQLLRYESADEVDVQGASIVKTELQEYRYTSPDSVSTDQTHYH